MLCVQNQTVPGDPRVWREARDLAAAGHAVTVICPRAAGLGRREVIEGVEILRYRPAPELQGLAGQIVETLGALIGTAASLVSLRRRGPIAVLHAANPPDTFFLLALLLRPSGTRFVYDQHDVCPELFAVRAGEGHPLVALFRWLERWSYRTADLVVAPNESYRNLALTRGRKRPEQVTVVRSGPDVIRTAERVPSSGTVVTFAGAMDEQDGVHLLLEAVAKLVPQRPELRVELIGRGSNVEALKEQAEALGITDRITWTGWLSGDEYWRRLGSATVAVSPDEMNPFTLVSTMTKVTDYLSTAVPCLVADLPENLVTGADAVAYFRAGDAGDLALQLDALLGDADRLADLSRRAARRAEELRWSYSREHLLAAYGRLLTPDDQSRSRYSEYVP